MTEVQSLPSVPLAEVTFLGGILATPRRYPEFRDVLAAKDFALDKHSIVWRAFERLYKLGTPIDRVTLYHALSEKEIKAAGGLTGLAEIDAPEIANLEGYAIQIRDAAIRRRLIVGASQLALEASAHGVTAAEALERARELVMGVEKTAESRSEFQTPLETIQEAGGIDSFVQGGCAAGLPLPWPQSQSIIGGFQPGDLCIVAADTGRGKTAFALNLALRTAEAGHGVAIFSMEMTRRQVLNRLMSLCGQFNSFVFRKERRTPVDDQNIMQAANQVAELPLYVRDATGCTTASLIGGLQRLRAKHDVRLVIVDYLQLMTGDGQNRTQQVGSVARGLKNAGMEFGVPVIALSQLSRDHSKVKTVPELHDLRESGDIEQAANLVMFLHGETTYSVAPSELLPIDLIIAKSRDGQARVKIPMMFRADCGLFTESE